MRPTLAAAALAGASGLVGWGGARALARRIERNPDPFPRERLLAEPQGERVAITRPDGTVLHALVAGRGTPVILVHGYCASLTEWNFVWDELLARGLRVIAFDQRGHGRSTLGAEGIGSEPMADDLAAVLQHFDLRDGVLVGHSMGGFVSIRALLDHGALAQRLRAVVLFATWAGRVLDGAPQNRLQIPLLERGILQRLLRSRTIAVLFGAAQCGARPSPAMISGIPRVVPSTSRPARTAPTHRAGVLARGSLSTAGRDLGAGGGDGGLLGSHHPAQPLAPAGRRNPGCPAGHRARRGTPAELGGGRRAGRSRRILCGAAVLMRGHAAGVWR
ncbi:conserved hypothetical membrane protein [Mycobacterium ulcerans Agy99]|uniref:Conserved hypothetical membrane protein n=1 Tax=Mycobacterium ulcerans (strain Agy99) TaxID=362242 RepID=A0PT22_MYCUA|nr:conserved hypothetical membrane protein [Mycobacterium ulcerans Agy99]